MNETIISQESAGQIRKAGLWLIVLGILQVIAGFFALNAPLFAGIVGVYLVGIAIMVNGLVEIFNCTKAPSWGWGVFGFLAGALGILAGALVIAHPLAGLNFLTLLMAFYFVFDGVDRFLLAGKLQGVEGRGWVYIGAFISVLLGILIFVQWPLASAWAVGVFAGIHILMGGWGKIIIGATARSAAG